MANAIEYSTNPYHVSKHFHYSWKCLNAGFNAFCEGVRVTEKSFHQPATSHKSIWPFQSTEIRQIEILHEIAFKKANIMTRIIRLIRSQTFKFNYIEAIFLKVFFFSFAKQFQNVLFAIRITRRRFSLSGRKERRKGELGRAKRDFGQ